MNDEDHKTSATPEKPAAQADQPVTLSDSEISTEPTLTRRSLLGAIGIGTGAFAAAIFGATNNAEARRGCADNNPYDRCLGDVTDTDPYDPVGDGYDRR